jgi:N-methylhydantoinase A
VNINTAVIGRRPPIDLARLIDPGGRAPLLDGAKAGERLVWFDGQWIETPIYWRDHLPIDAALTGPAIIEQMDTTTVIEPSHQMTSDADGNLIITVEQK